MGRYLRANSILGLSFYSSLPPLFLHNRAKSSTFRMS